MTDKYKERYHWYKGRGYSDRVIAELFDVSQPTLDRWKRKWKVKVGQIINKQFDTKEKW